jgi:hypothetical protein
MARLPIFVPVFVGGAPSPMDDRPMPEGIWRPCPVCRGLGEAMRYRVLFRLPCGWTVTERAGVGVCGACSGRGRVPH